MNIIVDEKTQKLRLQLSEDERLVVIRRFSTKTLKPYNQICLIDEKGEYHTLAFADMYDKTKKDMKNYVQQN